MTDPTSRVQLRTTGPDDTRAIAAAVSAVLRPGDVVALSGELGAGKTCFVQGAASGLGVAAPITSPTFVLVRQYLDGRIPLVHCDVYRLDALRDVLDLGDEVLAPDVVTFIEWGDAVRALLPDDRLEVELRHADPATGTVEDPDAPRLIELHPRGQVLDRLSDLRSAVADWITETR
ncbi:tRNA (adenosine(37)-N6)-threonylcarbamoyltransferase complex ATPase subunit type 1 TsaE [Nitriliruptoraceae bacterium ZYF776]|nr:tRNA (adenosine(37)-N6)-threonylcarbamoyltransferase complex ATPase subunit type 1 TsaE [Profundirhabdus halotolerans]